MGEKLASCLAKAHPRSVAWLLPAFLMLPVFLGAAIQEEANLPNAFQSLATSAVIWFPCLAVMATFRGKFLAIHATLGTLLFAVYDSFRVREILYEALDPIIGFGGNPNWITLAVIMAGVLIIGATTLVKPTLYRVVVLIACSAQVVTLVLFHTLTVIQPIDVARETEREFVSEFLKATGSLDQLCGIQDRVCHRGKPIDLAEKLDEEILTPSSVVRMLRDEADTTEVLFTWTESAFASTADEAMRHITIHKPAEDIAIVLINQAAPTRAFGQMKMTFSILAGAFQQAWVMLSLLILWRHGDYVFSGMRWRRYK